MLPLNIVESECHVHNVTIVDRTYHSQYNFADGSCRLDCSSTYFLVLWMRRCPKGATWGYRERLSS